MVLQLRYSTSTPPQHVLVDKPTYPTPTRGTEFLEDIQSDSPQSDECGRIGRRIEEAAAVDAVLTSVQSEINDDLSEIRSNAEQLCSEKAVVGAMKIARELALQFAAQPWIDIVGFVDTGRAAVLAHSIETGRRITFYLDDICVRALCTGVSEEPVWSEPQDDQGVRGLFGWICGID